MRYLILLALVTTQWAFGFAPTVELNKKTLHLNGVGIREATIFAVDVYKAALYLENKSNNAQKILASKETKQIDMRFVRDVDKDDLKEGWQKSFARNCRPHCQTYIVDLEKLNAFMPAIKKGDRMVFSFLPKRVIVSINQGPPLQLSTPGFSNFLPKLWIGTPPNKGLKKGLLGLS